jgi:alkyl hydroperoxide reductase subunit D
MSKLDRLKERLPDYAKDLRINLGAISSSTALAPAQAWGIAVTSAITARNHELVEAIEADAAAHLSRDAINAARGAASIMGMNNVYYRFLHYMGEASEYGHMPARLRMQLIGNPGIERLDFELECLAASAINGCEMCVRSHEKVVRDRGGTMEMVQETVRIASVVHAAAVTLEAA